MSKIVFYPFIWLLKNTNRFLIIPLVHISTKKLNKFPLHNMGISILLCHKDVHLALICLSSLFYFSKKKFPVFILDDGSLTDFDTELLTKFFNANILSRNEANRFEASIKQSSPSLFKLLRSKKTNPYKYKIELLLLSPFKRFIILDSDILFFTTPKEIIDWGNQKDKSFIYSDLNADTYLFRQKDLETNLLTKRLIYRNIYKTKDFKNIITSVVGIPDKSLVKIKKIDRFLREVDKMELLTFKYLEEMVFWNLFADLPNNKISPEKYYTYINQINTFRTKNKTMIHFPGTKKGRMMFYGFKTLVKILFKS